MYEGVYIDDHLVTLVLKKESSTCVPSRLCSACAAQGRCLHKDVKVIDQSRAAYCAAGLPLSSSKAFRYSEEFLAWGTQVHGGLGRIGAPIKKDMM